MAWRLDKPIAAFILNVVYFSKYLLNPQEFYVPSKE